MVLQALNLNLQISAQEPHVATPRLPNNNGNNLTAPRNPFLLADSGLRSGFARDVTVEESIMEIMKSREKDRLLKTRITGALHLLEMQKKETENSVCVVCFKKFEEGEREACIKSIKKRILEYRGKLSEMELNAKNKILGVLKEYGFVASSNVTESEMIAWCLEGRNKVCSKQHDMAQVRYGSCLELRRQKLYSLKKKSCVCCKRALSKQSLQQFLEETDRKVLGARKRMHIHT